MSVTFRYVSTPEGVKTEPCNPSELIETLDTLIKGENIMDDNSINQMVDRFLCWPLPSDFAPDCGISFDGRQDDALNKNKTWPVGTNLLTAEQAKQMFVHCLGIGKGI